MVISCRLWLLGWADGKRGFHVRQLNVTARSSVALNCSYSGRQYGLSVAAFAVIRGFYLKARGVGEGSELHHMNASQSVQPNQTTKS